MALKVIRIPAPWEGIDVDSSPNVVAADKAAVLQNYLTGEKGRVRQRGPMPDTGATFNTLVSALASHNAWASVEANDKLLTGIRLLGATRKIEPWVASYKPSAANTLATAQTGANTMSVADLAATALTALTPTDRERIPNGVRTARFGKFAYSISYDSVDDTSAAPGAANGIEATNYGTQERLTRLLRWDSTGVANPVIYVNMPKGSQDLRIWFNRLIMLGGRDPVTIGNGIDHNAIWFTRELTANDFSAGINNADAAATIWTDEVTGAVNKLTLSDDRGDPAVAFGAIGRQLAILKRRSIDVLTGFGADSWTIRAGPRGTGCLDPRSVIEVPEGVFFLSQHGYAFFDGTQVKIVSQGVQRTLLAAIQATVGDQGAAGGFAEATLLQNGYILLALGINAVNNATPTNSFTSLYHAPSNSWSSLDINTGASNHVTSVGATENRSYCILDSGPLRLLTDLTVPENVAEAVRGKDLGVTTVATKWHSRVVELASPSLKAHLHRVIIDYEWIVDASSEGDFIGPSVSLFNSHGSLLDAAVLPSQGDSGLEVTRGRYVWDTFVETSDIQVQIDYTGTARALVASSIIDVWIEFEPASESRGVFTTQ